MNTFYVQEQTKALRQSINKKLWANKKKQRKSQHSLTAVF